jgi:enoyl-CoA hydratase/carnithine racemase
MSAIDVTVTDGVATVAAEHFGPLGAYDAPFADELARAVVDAADDDAVKAIVLRANGPDFAPAAAPRVPDPQDVTTTWHRSFAAAGAVSQAVCFAKKVVITAVRGECAAAGSNLVLCSDLTVADDTARFASPFTDAPESNFVLAALTIRLNRAKSWMVRGTTIDAEQALNIGLVNDVTTSDGLDGAVALLTDGVTGMPLDGITMSKMLQQAVYDAHGVGREFDLADHYAAHRWSLDPTTSGGSR